MATAPANTGAPTRASSNVTRLPTAAPRKVEQATARRRAAARAALPQHPAEFLFSGQRKALRRAERLLKIDRTPALMIACAIYKALDLDTRSKVLGSMASALAQEDGPCRDAVEMMLTATATVGEQVDLDWALRRLTDGR